MLMLMLALGCTTETTSPADAPTEATHTKATPAEAAPAEAASHVCPMHPDITSDKPGACSECGMDLVKQEAHDHGSHDHGGHGEGEEAKKPAGDHHGH